MSLQLFDLAAGVMRILKLIMLMLLLSHWNGCIQFLVPVIQEYPSDSWITINRLKVYTRNLLCCKNLINLSNEITHSMSL